MTKSVRNLFSVLTNKPGVKGAGVMLLAAVTLLLSGCHQSGVLAPKGPIAATQLHLLIFAIILMLFVVIPVFFLSFWVAWRYREGKNATYRPNWSHSTLLECIWWAIPCLIILILAIVTWKTTHSLDPFKPLESSKKPVTIEVVALDWKWLFIYPDYHIATVNEITIPVGRAVEFKVTSAAPMNSLIIPQLGGQIYAMAGMKTKLHLIANEAGVYRGFSANYTGHGFAEMQFYATATTEAGFKKWIRTVKGDSSRLTWQRFWHDLAKPSVNAPVAYFGHVDNQLFDHIVMSYMMPNYKPGVMKMPKHAAMNTN